MSRRTGQLRAAESLIGALLVACAGVGVVALCTWLLLPAEQLPSLDTPSQEEVDQPQDVTCAQRLAAASRDSDASGALQVDSATLIECPAAFDGKLIAYRGEAVGAVLLRGDRAWTHLNDDVYALVAGPLPEHRQSVGGNSGIAVNIPAAAARGIVAVGGARHRGDVLAVRGPFRRAAVDDGEAPGIFARTVSDVRRGGPVHPPVSRRRVVVAAALLAVTVALGAVRLRPVRWD